MKVEQRFKMFVRAVHVKGNISTGLKFAEQISFWFDYSKFWEIGLYINICVGKLIYIDHIDLTILLSSVLFLSNYIIWLDFLIKLIIIDIINLYFNSAVL